MFKLKTDFLFFVLKLRQWFKSYGNVKGGLEILDFLNSRVGCVTNRANMYSFLITPHIN